MKNQIVASLQVFKAEVFGSLTTKDEIKNYLINVLRLSVWSGQKRLVVFDPQDKRYVYKIAYSIQGIIDNIHEVACSARLKELAQSGHISYDDLSLFALAELVEGDPFIIRQEAATNYIEDPDYVRWFNEYKANAGGAAVNENTLFAHYISQHPGLTNNANRQQDILAAFFKPSDATVFKEPKNFCFKNNSNGQKTLVLIDMGSICPNLIRNGQVASIRCNKCGSNKEYVSIRIRPNTPVNTSLDIEGLYLCTNHQCSDYSGKALQQSAVSNYTSKDSFVYSEFLQNNIDLVRQMRAQYGYFFMPNREVVTKSDYINEVIKTIGLRPDPQTSDILYRNYMSVACGYLLAQCIEDTQGVSAIVNGGLVPFGNYLQNFIRVVAATGINNNIVTRRTAALMYLREICRAQNNFLLFDTLSSPDFRTFGQTVSQVFGMDVNNGTLLYNCLNCR